MLSFEKCKELREAGFPVCKWDKVGMGCLFYTKYGECLMNCYPGNVKLVDLEIEGEVAIPTLEELIEECGERLKGLYPSIWIDAGWLALAENNQGTLNVEHRGVTIEEAVANLWLAINKK